MVKCEKRVYGYEIQIEGTTNELIGEMAHLVGSFHVNVMARNLHVDLKKDKELAIKASILGFGRAMELAMRDILDNDKNQIIVLDGSSEKGGAVQ